MSEAKWTRDDQVELFIDGNWIPAIVKNVNHYVKDGDEVFNYTVQPDLAGQPQFTNRPAVHYHTVKFVTEKSLKERGTKSVETPVDASTSAVNAPTNEVISSPVSAAPLTDATGNAAVEDTNAGETGSVNANAETPTGTPNTALNETPLTVEASSDPALNPPVEAAPADVPEVTPVEEPVVPVEPVAPVVETPVVVPVTEAAPVAAPAVEPTAPF